MSLEWTFSKGIIKWRFLGVLSLELFQICKLLSSDRDILFYLIKVVVEVLLVLRTTSSLATIC